MFKRGRAILSSIFDVKLESDFDVILTSPPFLNSTRFFANNRIRMWFCGLDYNQQAKMGDNFVDSIQDKDIRVYDKIFKCFNGWIKPEGICVLHLGVVKKVDMGQVILPFAEKNDFKKIKLVYENVLGKEKFGVTDQGVTNQHEFLILKSTK